MSEPIKTRPPQVTLASGMVMASSVVVLLTAWSQVAALGSLETQEAIAAALDAPPFDSLGLGAAALTDAVRVLALVSAVCACATGILGWYVRRPDRAARLALTAFAVPVFVAGLPGVWLPTTGIAGSFVAAGAAMLWLVPAREWFATGRWTPPPPREQAVERGTQSGTDRSGASGWPPPLGSPPQQQGAPTGAPPTGPPPATRPFGEHRPLPQQPGQGQTAPHPPYGQQPTARHPHPAAHSRPGGVVAAFVVTVVVAGGMLTIALLWVALVGLSPDLLMSTIERQQPDLVEAGLTIDDLRSDGYRVGGLFIVWCTVALVLAGFLMARRDWARRGLLVVAGLSAGGALALAVVNPLLVLPAAAAVSVVVCLRRSDVRRWSSSRVH